MKPPKDRRTPGATGRVRLPSRAVKRGTHRVSRSGRERLRKTAASPRGASVRNAGARTSAGPSSRGARSRRRTSTPGFYMGTALGGRKSRTGRRRAVAALGVLLAAAVIVLAGGRVGTLWNGVGQLAEKLHLGRAQVGVSGNRYLSDEEVLAAAGLEPEVSFFEVDLDSASALLRQHPRVRTAQLERRFNGRIRVQIEERIPVALVRGGELLEVDRDGRVLPPLLRGAVADLPILNGLARPKQGRFEDPDFQRALVWLGALAEPAVDLVGRVSEVDLASATETRFVLVPDGTRVLLPAAPPSVERLCALRVVLADLEVREIKAVTIDCRARGMVVVRPVPGTKTARGSDPLTAQKQPDGPAATL